MRELVADELSVISGAGDSSYVPCEGEEPEKPEKCEKPEKPEHGNNGYGNGGGDGSPNGKQDCTR